MKSPLRKCAVLPGTAVFASLALVCFAGEALRWSSGSNGLRIAALLVQKSRTSDFQVVLRNVGSIDLDVYVGDEDAKGITYDGFRFVATSPDGKQHITLLDFTARPTGGLLLPVVTRLSPGANHAFLFHPNDLGYVAQTKEVALGALLAQGYTVRVSLEIQKEMLETAVLGGLHSSVPLWTGRLTSSKVELLKSSRTLP